MSVRLEQKTPAAPSRRDDVRARAATERSDANFERLRAPFSLRCGALLIDYIALIAVMALATMFARVFDDVRRGSSLALTAGYAGVAAVAIINFVLLPAFSGRTLGKWIAGLRIERRDGAFLSFGRALVRHLAGYPLTILTLGLGFLIMVFDPQGRALHDWLAGTVVVRSRVPRAPAR
jgi:uncharacterized RDD family membrane protein YckC